MPIENVSFSTCSKHEYRRSQNSKKKTNKAQVKTVKKEKPQINEEVAQESHGINSSSWPALFNDMQLSSFAKNYFGNLSFARFYDQKIFLCGSKDQLDIPEKIISEFEEKIKDKFGNIEIGLEEGISTSSPVSYTHLTLPTIYSV